MNDEMKQKMIYDLALEQMKHRPNVFGNNSSAQLASTFLQICKEIKDSIKDEDLNNIFK